MTWLRRGQRKKARSERKENGQSDADDDSTKSVAPENSGRPPATTDEESSRSRATHIKRAYGLATLALGAVDNESNEHSGSPGHVPDPGPRFTKEMALLRPLVERAERLLDEAAQTAAQSHYGRGMFWGTAGLFVVSALIGGLFLERGWPAEWAIGVPAGGLGAVVSVLQRMTSGGLILNVNTGVSRLKWFGGLRPWVGGVFGLVLVALLEARLLNLEAPEGAAVAAFYGVLAFFSGFNERFAQDALAAAATPLGGTTRRGEKSEDGSALPSAQAT